MDSEVSENNPIPHHLKPVSLDAATFIEGCRIERSALINSFHQQSLSPPPSPHFAMITQQRIDNFQGTLPEYVTYLENKVKQLTRVHSPPSPESDTVFIQCDSEIFARPTKKARKPKPRWQVEMDGMLCDIPKAKEWSSKRAAVGLSSWIEILDAFDIIIDGAMRSAAPVAVESDRSIVRFEPADAFMRLLNRYANAVAVLDIRKRFTKQIVHFCQLVFVSLCCVLVYNGMDTSLVDDVMKIWIGPSDPKNLDVLRRGGRWANRMISALAKKGLCYRASEAFVLCGCYAAEEHNARANVDGTGGRSIAQYGRFVDAGERGFEYFCALLSVDGNDSSEPEPHAFLPFWIPYFIKTIVGDIYR